MVARSGRAAANLPASEPHLGAAASARSPALPRSGRRRATPGQQSRNVMYIAGPLRTWRQSLPITSYGGRGLVQGCSAALCAGPAPGGACRIGSSTRRISRGLGCGHGCAIDLGSRPDIRPRCPPFDRVLPATGAACSRARRAGPARRRGASRRQPALVRRRADHYRHASGLELRPTVLAGSRLPSGLTRPPRSTRCSNGSPRRAIRCTGALRRAVGSALCHRPRPGRQHGGPVRTTCRLSRRHPHPRHAEHPCLD